mgnify:CR=1 FL=1
MDDHLKQLNRAIDDWTERANACIDATEAYRLAHAKATSASQAKTDSGRKAEADEATSAQRLVRDRAELARDAAYHRMIGIRGSAGERQQ